MPELRMPVTNYCFFVGPASFDVEDWASLSVSGLRHLATSEEDRMIMVGTNIWSGTVGLTVMIGDPDELAERSSYQQREEAPYRVAVEEPYVAWSFDVSAQMVLPALPVGDYRIVLFGAGIQPNQYAAVAAHDTGERYWMVFEPTTQPPPLG